MKEFGDLKSYLEEKLIMPNNGAKSGQVVFMAGGAGSGKGYAVSNLMNGFDYKVVDPDAFKEAVVKIGKLHFAAGKESKFVQFKDINFRNPEDVSKIHLALKDWPLEQKHIANMLLPHIIAKAKQNVGLKAYGGQLPNILFDRTLKNVEEIKGLTDTLISAGYQKTNMHIIWVLTNWRVAMVNNDNRPRRVPDHILLLTHEGVGKTMSQVAKGAYPPNVNGDVYLVLGGGEGQVFYSDKSGKPLDGKTLVTSMIGIDIKDAKGKNIPRPTIPQRVIKSFVGIKIKNAGSPTPVPEDSLKRSLAHFLGSDIDSIQKLIAQNVPPSEVVRDFEKLYNDHEGEQARAKYGIKPAPKE